RRAGSVLRIRRKTPSIVLTPCGSRVNRTQMRVTMASVPSLPTRVPTRSSPAAADRLRPPDGVRQAEGLAPMDEPGGARRLVEGRGAALLLVGHLPHLSRLASLLLVEDPDKEVVSFRMGGIVCLGRGAEGWRLRWFLTPETAGD
ncbi:MAG: hypothetical protein ACE5IM_09445, partial [Nitrospinota bacterium]